MLAMRRPWGGWFEDMPIVAIPLRFFKSIDVLLWKIRIAGGRVEYSADGIDIYPNTDGGHFTGTAYIAGQRTTGLGTKAWVRVFLSTATAEDHDGPPPDPFPPDEEWYETRNIYGDLHIPRA